MLPHPSPLLPRTSTPRLLILDSLLPLLLIILQTFLLPSPRPVNADIPYNPSVWNATCRYSAYSVPLPLFYNGTDDNGDPIFPLYVSPDEPEQYKFCFGPGERYNDTLITTSDKLPCNYTLVNNATLVNYHEEQPCATADTTNCYCYALDRRAPGFCSPGIYRRRRPFNDSELATCVDLVNAVASDGGRPVNRSTVYSRRPAGTHYIAAAINPRKDFHFWRLDSPSTAHRHPNGTLSTPPSWSYKAGGTFARNTFRNGAPLTDPEDPAARGPYTLFCGYFDVDRSTHRVGFVRNPGQELAAGYRNWVAQKVHVKITRLPAWSPGWYGKFKDLYADVGWLDAPGAKPRSPGGPSPSLGRAGPSTGGPSYPQARSPAAPIPSPAASPSLCKRPKGPPASPKGASPEWVISIRYSHPPLATPAPSPLPSQRPTPQKTTTITITPIYKLGVPVTVTITSTSGGTSSGSTRTRTSPTTSTTTTSARQASPHPQPAKASVSQGSQGASLPRSASRRRRRRAWRPQLMSRVRCPSDPCRWELLP